MNTEQTAAETELAEVARILRECLARLDRVGAGIAAIHVNAAIEHLAALGEGAAARFAAVPDPMDAARQGSAGRAGERFASIDPRLLCILPATGQPH
ncbi:hypothetical protein [Erythrobacter sp.]|uniref:hypothetical protein n=1 Tax=Erythrobacter sp. TaxID=1042 RepID=UPI002EAEE738|nr:hypothetical protein [Erythrobacter sp.]